MSLKITWVTPTRMARILKGQIITHVARMWTDLNTHTMLVGM